MLCGRINIPIRVSEDEIEIGGVTIKAEDLVYKKLYDLICSTAIKPNNLIKGHYQKVDFVNCGPFYVEAPPERVYRLIVGKELGYHCHLSRLNYDTGWLLTLYKEIVYAERHRIGKTEDSFDIFSLGKKAKEYIREQTISLLGRFPTEARRPPSIKNGKALPF